VPNLVDDLIDQAARYKKDRSQWESVWQDLAPLFLPRRVHEFSRIDAPQSMTEQVFNSIGIFANERLAAALGSLLINPAVQWFALEVPELRDKLSHEEATYVRETQDDIRSELDSAETGFHPQMHETFLDVTSTGTAVMFEGLRDDENLYFATLPIAHALIGEDAYGRVNRVYRYLEFDEYQAKQYYGDALPKLPSQGEGYNGKHCFLNAVVPEGDSWKSYHIMQNPRKLIKTSQFFDFPYMCPRWSKLSGETYGRSPALTALPEVRMLQRMSKVYLQAAQRAARPPMMAPDDGFLAPLRTAPDSLNIYRASSRLASVGIQALPGGNPQLAQIDIQAREEVVKRIFYVDLFMSLISRGDASPLKAAEVMGREQEAMLGLTPIIARLQQELLAPIINRTFRLLQRAGKLPSIPDTLQGKNITVRFVSPSVIAQRMSEVNTQARFLQLLAGIASLDARAAKLVNGEIMGRRVAAALHIHPDILRPTGEVEKLVNDEMQQRQAMQAAQVAETASKAVGGLGG